MIGYCLNSTSANVFGAERFFFKQIPSWGTCADDVRTWIEDTTEYFALPDLDAASCDITVPQHKATSKTV